VNWSHFSFGKQSLRIRPALLGDGTTYLPHTIARGLWDHIKYHAIAEVGSNNEAPIGLATPRENDESYDSDY
jgi:hypothetical protein